jgi:hypothetical protein
VKGERPSMVRWSRGVVSGARAERDADVLLLAVVGDGEIDSLAEAGGGQAIKQRIGMLDGYTIDRGDDLDRLSDRLSRRVHHR